MPRLRLQLLGPFQAHLDNVALTGFRSDKSRALLAYLAAEANRVHRRETLACLFWGDFTDRAARRSLSTALANLRAALAPLHENGDAKPVLATNWHEVVFTAARDVVAVDVIEFERLLAESAAHEHRSLVHCRPCAERLTKAVGLYGGSFLAGLTLADAPEFDEWHRLRALASEQKVLAALDTLTHHHIASGNLGPAEHYARRQISIDGLREAAHRQLMTVLAASGQRSAALAQYEICRKALQRDLGVQPEEETTALYRELLAGSLNRQVALARPVVVNPYKGLNAFATTDAPDYYGRESITSHLLEVFDRRPVVGVVGPSGCGKSSLVQAGLLYRLAEDAGRTLSGPLQPAGLPPWSVCQLRPGAAPLRSLAAALVRTLADADFQDRSRGENEDALADRLRAAPASLRQVVAAFFPAGARRVLIVCDQAEELFTLCPDAGERIAFLDVLTGHARADDAGAWLKVLITLRADFMGQLLLHRPMADALQGGTVILGPMSHAELESAIVLPARAQGAEWQDGLVARLLADVGGDAGRLPLLQFCLTQLWQRQPTLHLTHQAYEAIGGVGGALARYADETYAGFSDSEKLAARRVLTQMVRPGVDTADTRRPVTRGQLAPADWAMVQRLANARLVVTDRDATGQETAEIVHEALIQGWGLLHSWLDADRAFYLWQEQTRAAAAQWRATGYDAGSLLRGVLLATASGWAAERGEDLGPDVGEYVAVSQAQHDLEAAQVAARQARELEQAHVIAQAERRRFQSEAQANRRLRWLAGGMAFVALLALAGGLAAWSLQRVAAQQAELARRAEAIAQQQATQSLARQLAAQAINLAGVQPDLAALLGNEALRRGLPGDRRDLLLNLEISPLLKTMLHGHGSAIYTLATAGDGRLLASGSEHGSIRLWNLETAREVANLTGAEDAAVRALAFSPDDSMLASGDSKGRIRLWNPDSGELLREWSGHSLPVSQLLFGADGRTLRSISEDGYSRLWEVATGQEAAEAIPLASSQGMAVSQAGDELASKRETTITVQSLAGGLALPVTMLGHSGLISDMEFSPDGRLLATTSFDGLAIVWDVRTGQPAYPALEGHEGRVLSAAFSPDGALLATAGTDGRIRLWDAATGTPLAAPGIGHTNWVRVLQFTPDGQQLISGDAAGDIMVWNVGLFRQLAGHSDTTRPVAFSPDGRTLASGSYDTTVRRWDVASGQQVGEPLQGHQNSVIALDYSPDGKLLVSGSAGGDVVFWDAATGQQLAPAIKAHDSAVLDLAFSPDGRTMASGGFDEVVKLWDVASRSVKGAPLKGHEGWILAVAYSPDGSLLASAGVDATVRFWDAATGEARAVLPTQHTGWVTSLAFSPDGATLVTGSLDETVRLWDVESGQLLGTPLTGHAAGVWSVGFDPARGETLLSVDGSGTALWWDVATRQPLAPPLHAGIETEGAALSPDGSLLAISDHSQTGNISLWRVQLPVWEERACRIADRNLTLAEWRQYLGDLPYAPTCPDQPDAP